MILEQLNRQSERRCPVAMASNEVVELLADHWSVYSAGRKSYSSSSDILLMPLFSVDSTSTTYQPLFLTFNKVHHLATRFFLRCVTSQRYFRCKSEFNPLQNVERERSVTWGFCPSGILSAKPVSLRKTYASLPLIRAISVKNQSGPCQREQSPLA